MVIIDVGQNFKVERKPMTADAVMMHPDRNVIACRAKNAQTGNTTVQVGLLDPFMPNLLGL